MHIGHHKGELALRVGGFEGGAGLEDPVRRAERVRRVRGQALGQRGELVRVPHSGEQFVAEVAAQPGQRGTHGGLAQPQPLSRPRHTALLQQRVQRQQQVQIQTHVARPPRTIAVVHGSIGDLGFSNSRNSW